MDRNTWLQKLGEAIDAKDAEGFANFMTEGGTFRFGNQPPVQGREAIRDYVDQFFKMIQASEHEILDFWEQDGSIIWKGKVKYTRLDDKQVTVDFCNIFHMEDDLVDQYLIYIDNTPLFA